MNDILKPRKLLKYAYQQEDSHDFHSQELSMTLGFL